jgi:hypothetical protein
VWPCLKPRIDKFLIEKVSKGRDFDEFLGSKC